MRLLLDSNVLLLLLVGRLDVSKIGSRKLSDFDMTDFQLALFHAHGIPRHISTPHILTEVSNHLGDSRQYLVSGGLEALRTYAYSVEEIVSDSRSLTQTSDFLALGLTDAAIMQLADLTTRVITVDHHLCGRLSAKGVEVINLRHFRTPT